jgi:hypothetical protein
MMASPGMLHSDSLPVADRSPSIVTLDALADALTSERTLIDELTAVMLRQREAVRVEDIQTVDDSVFATHRLLLTLGEARRGRRQLNRLLGFPEELGVRELEEALGSYMTPRLREERDALRSAAQRLSREIEINRRILREALAQSETYVRAMRGIPAETAPVYSTHGTAAYAPSQPASFSRTV